MPVVESEFACQTSGELREDLVRVLPKFGDPEIRKFGNSEIQTHTGIWDEQLREAQEYLVDIRNHHFQKTSFMTYILHDMKVSSAASA